MSPDLQSITGGWKFDPGDEQKNVRRIVGDDGKEKVQVRIKCGLLQWDVDGRPDGARPYGRTSLLDHCRDLIAQHERKHGSTEGFQLKDTLTQEVREEVMDYYHRRVVFFHLEDYERARDDAVHNLQLMGIIKDFVSDEEIVMAHERYRAFVTMDRTRAEAMLCVRRGKLTQSLELIDRGMEEIEEFYREYDREDIVPESQELKVLRTLKQELRRVYKIPMTVDEMLTELEEQKAGAIEEEDYEKAAKIRDKIAFLQNKRMTGSGAKKDETGS